MYMCANLSANHSLTQSLIHIHSGSGSDVITSCQYACPCTENGCEVAMVDRRQKQSAVIWEISLMDVSDYN